MKEAIFQALLGGVLIGLASWLLLASLGKIAGVTGIVAAALAPNLTEKTEQAAQAERAWRWVFIAGLILGGSMTSQYVMTPSQTMRPMWVLIVAGLCVGYGTIIGSGCTSGHGVCGLGRRSMRSLVATVCFMVAGMITVFVVNFLTAKPML